MIKKYGLLMFILLLATGCATEQNLNKRAMMLFKDGNEHFAKANYDFSKDSYKKIVDRYPGTRYMAHAMLGLADSYYMRGDFDLAVPQYKRFQELYPVDSMASHAMFYEAMSNYRQVQPVPRDQTFTRNALELFSLFSYKNRSHPAKPTSEKISKELGEALSQELIFVIRFYYRTEGFISCIERVDQLVTFFPGSKYLPEAILIKARALVAEESFENAKKAFEQLINGYADTPEAETAKAEMANLPTI